MLLTKPDTGKEKPHPRTATEGRKPCVTNEQNPQHSTRMYKSTHSINDLSFLENEFGTFPPVPSGGAS